MDAEIRVEVESGHAIYDQSGKVLVYFGDRLIATVVSKIEWEQGGDGKLHPCVKQHKTYA